MHFGHKFQVDSLALAQGPSRVHPRSRQHSPDGSLVTLQIRAIHPIAIKMSPSGTASPGSFIKTRCPCLPPTHPMGVQTSIDEAAKPAEGWRLQDGWRRARRSAHLCGGRRGGPAALGRATRESRAARSSACATVPRPAGRIKSDRFESRRFPKGSAVPTGRACERDEIITSRE